MKFSKNKSWLLAALAMVGILIGAVVYVKSNKKFNVTYSAGFERPGYEPAPSEIYVYSSTNLKWKGAPKFWKAAGWLFLLSIPVIAWVVGTDRVHGKKKTIDPVGRRTAIEIVIFFAPVLLCLVCWFGAYSASLAEGKIKQNFGDFKKQYQIDDDLAAKIVKQEVTSIKDKNGLLTEYFMAN